MNDAAHDAAQRRNDRDADTYAAPERLRCGPWNGGAGLRRDTSRRFGLWLREGSSDWMANAFAGDTAKAYDASTAWSNPAGMVRLNQSEVDGSINGIFPTINFNGANVTGRTTTTPGSQGGNLIQSAATGGTFGFGATLPT